MAKNDDVSHIGVNGYVGDSEYLSLLCNPHISSLRAEVSSRAIVDINDSVATSTTLRLLYLLLHSPSQLLASAQLMYKTSNRIHPHLKMLCQAMGGHPATLLCLVILQQT